MKMRELGSVVLIVFIGLCAVGGYISTRWLGDENPLEEAAEAAIKEVSGYDIDISYETPEGK